jgi:putative transposase
MRLVTELSPRTGIAPACAALGLSRATYYNAQKPPTVRKPRPKPVRALAPAEREQVVAVLHEPRFADQAPAEIYATLLDEKRYLCSERTLYRVLAADAVVRDRRDQLRHPHYTAPQLLATRPNELWSWDITKLLGPTRWTYYYLYVLLDVFSRYVVGWLLAEREAAVLAGQLIAQSCERQGIRPGQLTVHADNGAPMKAKTTALLLADLGVTRTHSRPHVSNDNPFSESQFKTIKYRPDFPERFGSLEHGRSFCGDLFPWYNTEHHHVGLGLFTPHDVHYGLAEAKREQRARVLAEAFARNPERFPNGLPQPKAVPTAVWINPPKRDAAGSPTENATTPKSKEVAIVDPEASSKADLTVGCLGTSDLTTSDLNMTAAQ